MLLNRVIRQVHHSVRDIGEVVLAARGAYVALLVVICLEVAVDVGREAVRADVKLPALVEQWIVNIFLDDVGSSREQIASLDDLLDILEIFCDFNSTSPVRVLARLDDPHIVVFFNLIRIVFLEVKEALVVN